MIANSLVELDRAHLLHPSSAPRLHEKQGVQVLVAGRGAYLRDLSGRELLDGFAGLWCVNAGYGIESVVRAAAEQMLRLPYATNYFSYGSEPAIRLAARLAELAPPGLTRSFFTLGGSDAVDSALRLIAFYWQARGQSQRRHVLSLTGGYHGSSSAGAGVTALAAFHRGVDFSAGTRHRLTNPSPYRHPEATPAAIIAFSVAELRALVARLGSDQVAAVFCEPIQGSGGVLVPPDGWMAAMLRTCRELDILFVADEVITGFGRTGPVFACEHEGVSPDLMTMAKGLTSGYAPMGAVMLSETVYNTIADDGDGTVPLGHGLTYSGHPVSAAVALEVIRLYTEEGLFENGQRMGALLQHLLHERFNDHPLVGNVRGRGMLAGIELVGDKRSKAKLPAALGVGDRLTSLGDRHRVIFRAFGDGTIGLAPPLCCTAEDIALLVDRLDAVLCDLLNETDLRRALAA